MSNRDVERSQFEGAFGDDGRVVEQAVEDEVAYARAPLAHNEAGTNVVTGTSVPAGKCPLCSTEMTLLYVRAAGRVQAVCPVCSPELFEP